MKKLIFLHGLQEVRKFLENKMYSSCTAIVVLLLDTFTTLNILEELKIISFLSLPIILMDTRRRDLPQRARSERRPL